eukprot:gnl/TRDRNA2_/TRDRNA2_133515_c0_seq2.p1 gnl/TRDRNA2_/TRDRNA2_133515_c0~~gnl/TRDRNA2_/TRDRNA2_133515_c0_seq2.p1  ORF type:complete len:272 (-),score=38.26 gnl/TRDRNA2_/TRDRNA2_133515_c0_seq2:13-828(-)
MARASAAAGDRWAWVPLLRLSTARAFARRTAVLVLPSVEAAFRNAEAWACDDDGEAALEGATGLGGGGVTRSARGIPPTPQATRRSKEDDRDQEPDISVTERERRVVLIKHQLFALSDGSTKHLSAIPDAGQVTNMTSMSSRPNTMRDIWSSWGCASDGIELVTGSCSTTRGRSAGRLPELPAEAAVAASTVVVPPWLQPAPSEGNGPAPAMGGPVLPPPAAAPAVRAPRGVGVDDADVTVDCDRYVMHRQQDGTVLWVPELPRRPSERAA